MNPDVERFQKGAVLFCGLVFILFVGLTTHAQTLSNCRPSPPLRPSARIGVIGLTLSRDGKMLVVAGSDARIRFVDITTGDVRRTLTGHTNAVYIGVFSPDERLLASSSRDRTARIWNLATGQEIRQFNGFRCSVKAVAFSPDGRMLAASGNDGMLKLWDVRTGTELKSLVHKNSAEIDMATYAFVFNRDGKKIYAGNGDGSISEWDVDSGRETKAWQAHDQTAFKLVFSPDYRILASFGDSVVKLWDTSTWRELRSMSMSRPSTASYVSSMLAMSHDGKLIAASNIGLDPKQNTYLYVQTMVWKVKTGEKLFTFEGHKFDVDALVFSRDDRYLLTGSIDTTIKFWDMKTGQEARTLKMPASETNK